MKNLDGEIYLSFAEATEEIRKARNDELARVSQFIAKLPDDAQATQVMRHVYKRSPAIATAMYEGPASS
ncbi:hypothetical protein [Subtercola sp. RTI3]|uniref:hypothetical protein n=1 Tax=Subtercola sp. RTI3 TaxID=3048639 RepID=UPI002B22E1E8|nr:hypothetical protein [Subtercola sp. RTI3]MEA9985670.1 hypothetical protein [Subtercola sp. RTI3]